MCLICIKALLEPLKYYKVHPCSCISNPKQILGVPVLKHWLAGWLVPISILNTESCKSGWIIWFVPQFCCQEFYSICKSIPNKMEVCLSKYHGCLVGSMETLNFFEIYSFKNPGCLVGSIETSNFFEIYSFKYPGCLVGTTDPDSRFVIFENDGCFGWFHGDLKLFFWNMFV